LHRISFSLNKINIKNYNEIEFAKIKNQLQTKFIKTDAGILKILIFNNELFESEFIENYESLKFEDNIKFSSINLIGTDFQIKVLQALIQIPMGKAYSYQDIANQIGKPNAVRAVANAIARNKIAYFVPCHRIIRKNGQIGGYKWGSDRKNLLLKLENDR